MSVDFKQLCACTINEPHIPEKKAGLTRVIHCTEHVSVNRIMPQHTAEVPQTQQIQAQVAIDEHAAGKCT